MRLKEAECFNCGAKLQKVSDTEFRCGYCNSTYVVGALKKQQKEKKKQEKQQEKEEKKQNVHKTMNRQPYRSTVGAKYSYNSTAPSDTFSAIVKFLGIMFLFLMAGVALIAACMWVGDLFLKDSKREKEVKVEASGVFKQVASQIYGKEYDDITDTEWESATELVLYNSGTYLCGTCVVGGQTKEFCYGGTVDAVSGDIWHFSNLEVYDREGYIKSGEINELKNLKSISCKNGSNTLAKWIVNPQNITHLSGINISSTPTGLESFTNLESLEFIIENVSDLSFLKNFTKLENISIDSYDDLKGFDVLRELTSLKSVYIDSKNVYSIEFVEDLPNLESLILEELNDSMDSLAPLKGRTNLKCLDISDCKSIKDYEVLSTLTGLEELGINSTYFEGDVQWENLKNVKKVLIRSAGNEMLKYMTRLPNLEELKLDGWVKSLDVLGKHTGLKRLTITGTLMTDLSGIVNFPNLEYLCIMDVRYADYGEAMFASNKLKTLIVYGCSADVDYSKIQDNPNLEELSLGYANFNNYDLKNNMDILKHFPNVRELNLRGVKLDNLEFLNGMPYIEGLDVTNNNLSDSKMDVLQNCKNLKVLWCGDNALTKSPTFSWNVRMYMEEESNSIYKMGYY